jgi:hypothetical protein
MTNKTPLGAMADMIDALARLFETRAKTASHAGLNTEDAGQRQFSLGRSSAYYEAGVECRELAAKARAP